MAGKHAKVELVYATPERQQLRELTVEVGMTIAQLIDESGIRSSFPNEDLASAKVGVWGRLVDRDYVVSDGDRIEIYRSLRMDPRDARRLLAEAGRTMNQRRDD